MVSICFVEQKNNTRMQVDYHISEFTLRNFYKECSLCKNKIQKVYVLENWKNSNLENHLIYCKDCFESQLKHIKEKIYNVQWNVLIFLINNYGFTIERLNLTKARCDFCYSMYIRFKVKLYPICLENKLCIKCFKDKLNEILWDFERNIFII
jgi:hypothetical protein